MERFIVKLRQPRDNVDQRVLPTHQSRARFAVESGALTVNRTYCPSEIPDVGWNVECSNNTTISVSSSWLRQRVANMVPGVEVCVLPYDDSNEGKEWWM